MVPLPGPGGGTTSFPVVENRLEHLGELRGVLAGVMGVGETVRAGDRPVGFDVDGDVHLGKGRHARSSGHAISGWKRIVAAP